MYQIIPNEYRIVEDNNGGWKYSHMKYRTYHKTQGDDWPEVHVSLEKTGEIKPPQDVSKVDFSNLKIANVNKKSFAKAIYALSEFVPEVAGDKNSISYNDGIRMIDVQKPKHYIDRKQYRFQMGFDHMACYEYEVLEPGSNFKGKVKLDVYNDGRIKLSNQVQFVNLAYSPPRRQQPIDPERKTEAELKAQDTLRCMIPESEFRRYITNGFVMVESESGKFYQVFHNHHVRIFQAGECIGTVCIHINIHLPPTDYVLTVKRMIELDEQTFLKSGNVRMKNDIVPTIQYATA